MNEWTLINKK